MAELAHQEVLERTPGEGPDRRLVDAPGVRVEAVTGLALAVVSLHPGSARKRAATAFRRALAERLGVARLPSAPNTRAGTHPCAIWLAPQRWLLVAERDSALHDALGAALADVDAAAIAANVCDTSDAALVLELSGRRAGELVAMGCSLDLDAPALAAGRSARTLFAGQPALLYRHGAGYRVHLDATLAVFVCRWCRQAARLLAA